MLIGYLARLSWARRRMMRSIYRIKQQRGISMDHTSGIVYLIITIVVLSRFDLVITVIYNIFKKRG
jgi:hypothetical protein